MTINLICAECGTELDVEVEVGIYKGHKIQYIPGDEARRKLDALIEAGESALDALSDPRRCTEFQKGWQAQDKLTEALKAAKKGRE